MQTNYIGDASKPMDSKVKLALGAASLFLFLVGVKRSFRMDDVTEIREDPESGQRAAHGGTLREERAHG